MSTTINIAPILAIVLALILWATGEVSGWTILLIGLATAEVRLTFRD